MNKRNITSSILLCGTLSLFAQIPERPNIIWLMAEDMGQDLSCYGMQGVSTPVLDQLAAEGVQYNAAVCANPISSPNRSAMLTGVTQVVTNSHNHRSNRDTPIAEQFKPFTYYLREAGYTCILGNSQVMRKGRKVDCNFKYSDIGEWNGKDKFGLFDAYDEIPTNGEPFFAQIQLIVTHRGDWWNGVTAASKNPVDTAEIKLPPYMPNHPQVRKEWASYLDQVEYMDNEISLILDQLREKGLLENTIIFFIGDNGRCDIKGKGYLYEPGLKIPMIAWGKGVKPTTENSVVSVLDITATILDLAGVEIPTYYEGKPLFDRSTGNTLQTRELVYSARDTWDEVAECIRAITTSNYKYIRNYMPNQPWDMHQQYLDFHRPALHIMRAMYARNELKPAERLFLAPIKPVEELYDIKADPHELHNLALDTRYTQVLFEMRNKMDTWQSTHNDMGLADMNNRTPEDMGRLREYLQNERPDVWQYIIEGNIMDNYTELNREAKAFYAK